jgi:hypothetical protein
VLPFGGGDRARANEGQREQFERVSGQVITAPLIDFDLPEKLAEFDGIGDRRPMRLPMLRKASGEIAVGEWRGAIFGPKAVRLGIGDDLAGGRDKADAGWMVDRFQDLGRDFPEHN